MTRTAQDLVTQEVGHCVSQLVNTMAQELSYVDYSRDMTGLLEQAFELSTPIPDYESAAYDEGWRDVTDTDEYPPETQFKDETDGQEWACSGWQELCEDHSIEPHYREIYEHWIVSDWLADKLEAKGERIDRDFAGLTIWGRTTTGQAIMQDHVIEQIAAELNERIASL